MVMKASKRILGIVTAIAVLISAVPVFAAAPAPYPQDIKSIEADLSGKTVILHTNDVHGAISGYAKIAALKQDLTESGAEVILADAGDYMQGNLEVSYSSGKSAVALMNAAGYDVATIGNHEFDFGRDAFFSNIEKAEFKILCANLYENGKRLFDGHMIYETAGGVKIGFIGIDTPEAKTKSMPGNTVGLEFLSGKEMIACAQKEADALRAEGADLVVALGHLGVNAESAASQNSSFDLYAGVKGLDLVIDGHSHTVMTEGPNGEPIQSVGTKSEYIGVVVIDEDGKIEDRFLTPTEGLRSDETVKALEDSITAEADAAYAEVFARSEVFITGDRGINRGQESVNGDLTADAFRYYIETHPEAVDGNTDMTVCLINGGSIRDSLPEGDITRKHIFNIHPFNNTLSIVQLSGSELLELLEASTFCLPDITGGYPQTNGIKFTVDCTKEFDGGDNYPGSTYKKPASINRVSIQEINGKSFDINGTYYIATSNFLAAGGDSAGVFAGKEVMDTGIGLETVLISYISEGLSGVIPASKYSEVRGDAVLLTEKASEETAAGTAADIAPAPIERIYIVVKGDCLYRIAERLLGDPLKWRSIYNLNRNIIKNPNLIYPGQQLRLAE